MINFEYRLIQRMRESSVLFYRYCAGPVQNMKHPDMLKVLAVQ